MKKLFVPALSLIIFYLAVSFLFIKSTGLTDGRFIYTLDDPYIHLAIAKNFAMHCVWGITQYEFTSCSSSPLWTFLISTLYLIAGVKDIIPFLLNVIFASLTAITTWLFIKRFTDNKLIQALVPAVILFLSPLVSVVFTGLEHAMYSFLIVLASLSFYKFVNENNTGKKYYSFFILLFLLCLARYEGLFFAFAVILAFLFKRKFSDALFSFVFSALPVATLGIIFVSKGWSFFPNSVLLKSGVSFSGAGSFIISLFNPQFFELLFAYKRILILLVISVVMFFLTVREEKATGIRLLVVVFVIVTLVHFNFARLGSFMRYEMYIIVLGMLINSILIIIWIKGRSKTVKIIVGVFVLLVIIPFSISTIKAVNEVSTASANVYRMQFQMSEFIKKYYINSTVALNDIGAVNYYCDIHCVDMWGLADMEIAGLRKSGKYNSQEILRINNERKTEIAIVFDSWFEKYGGLPGRWIQAGKWTIPDNITCGADSVTFYAVDSSAYKKLARNLKEYSKILPVQVKQSGY